VRGIFHTTTNYKLHYQPGPWPDDYPTVPSLETGDPELLNPDGFTVSYRPVSGGPDIFRYQPGGDLGGTYDEDDVGFCDFWPFINFYSSDVRRHFATNATVTRTYHVALPPGEWEFGYTVDACWAKPTNVPVTDIEADFPMQANTLLPYRIDAFASGPIIGSTNTVITMRFYNHVPEFYQFYDRVFILAGCFTGGNDVVVNSVIVDDLYIEYSYDLYNAVNRPPGRYPIVINSEYTSSFMSYLDDIEKYFRVRATIFQVVWVTVEESW